MDTNTVKFRDWVFEVNKALTKLTYQKILSSGADTCRCNDCKNYITYRDRIFPKEVVELFNELGIDPKKEVEITVYESLPNGFQHIGGWFHFKGRVLKGKDCRIPLPSGGHVIDLTPIAENFSIGFSIGNDLTFFDDEKGLVQVEFETNVPWVIGESLETVHLP